jgi:hypothetical protein
MVQLEGLCKLKKISELIRARTHDHLNSFSLTIFLVAGSGFLDTIVLTPFCSPVSVSPGMSVPPVGCEVQACPFIKCFVSSVEQMKGLC